MAAFCGSIAIAARSSPSPSLSLPSPRVEIGEVCHGGHKLWVEAKRGTVFGFRFVDLVVSRPDETQVEMGLRPIGVDQFGRNQLLIRDCKCAALLGVTAANRFAARARAASTLTTRIWSLSRGRSASTMGRGAVGGSARGTAMRTSGSGSSAIAAFMRMSEASDA